MVHRPSSVRIVSTVGVGFASVILMIWADELFDLPHRLFGVPPVPTRWAEAGLESGLVLLLGMLVIWHILRVVSRMAYLESFVVLCAWCRRVRFDEQWIPLEAFLAEHRAVTSHGVCDTCAARLDAGVGEGIASD